MTAALEGGEWSAARPGRTSPPVKTRYPFYRRLCGPQGRSGWAENLVLTGIRSRTVQPVVSRYTDWATKAGPMLEINWIEPLLLKICTLLYCRSAFHSDEKFEACSYVPQFHCDFSESLAYRHCVMTAILTFVIAPVALAMYCISGFVKQGIAVSSASASWISHTQ